MTITATLKNALYFGNGDVGCYGGNIYDDIRKRWPDGTFIWTSKVLSVVGNIVTTQNSIYEVEMLVASSPAEFEAELSSVVVAVERDTANA